MAMDKERLFAYFQTSYLSREDVLFKLPFSVSIENFWPELMNRRKAHAVVLPLSGANGMPCWYCLTDKMIAASERICEKTLMQEEKGDPFNAPMTSAMTEEMFFTSFVEGAQIPIADAFSFLQSDAEPEDVQEQMLWNNRQAWTAMAKSLLRPLDEAYVKGLAFLLTRDMDGEANDYRQTDTHPIVAMEDTPYTVPPACALPERMREFYVFLRNPDVHPLIKASAAQAFLLVTRPFPEGNERLSRMLSAAVLLRSGYSIFRGISISSVIARENYRYYKAMREILRTDSGGDLTYFMEYYLELLVRAMVDREDRDKRLEQEKREAQDAEHEENLIQERKLAATPLSTVPNGKREEIAEPCTAPPDDIAHTPLATEATLSADSPGWERIAPDKTQPVESPPPDREAYIRKIRDMAADAGSRTGMTQKMEILLRFMERGIMRFTVLDYQKEAGGMRKAAYRACCFFFEKGLVTRECVNGVYWYVMAYQDATEEPTETVAETTALKTSDLYDDGEQRQQCCPTHTAAEDAEDVPAASLQEPTAAKEEDNPLLERLDVLCGPNATERDKRIAAFLRERILSGRMVFRREELSSWRKFCKSVLTKDLCYAINLGLIERSPKRIAGTCGFEYRICTFPRPSLNVEHLTELQIHYLSQVYRFFEMRDFTVIQLANRMQIKSGTVDYHLTNLRERGLLQMTSHGGYPARYRLVITPAEHSECFEAELLPEQQPAETPLRHISPATGYAAASSSKSAVALSV